MFSNNPTLGEAVICYLELYLSPTIQIFNTKNISIEEADRGF
jgi:hypothetical protein